LISTIRRFAEKIRQLREERNNNSMKSIIKKPENLVTHDTHQALLILD
jgi:hypothetical protein